MLPFFLKQFLALTRRTPHLVNPGPVWTVTRCEQ